MQGHLIIGPPSSGKSTIARTMAPVFQAEIISSDIIRKDIYGNEEVQGDWSEIFNLIKKKIIECINNEKNFIVDATNAKRSWRLNFTQNFYPLTEIDWIGWWVITPKEICIEWNKNRSRRVKSNLIENYWEIINDSIFGPQIAEGFKDLKNLNPVEDNLDSKFFKLQIEKIKKSIIYRKNNYPPQADLHDYSALIDFERLLYLINFFSNNPFYLNNDNSITNQAKEFLKNQFGDCYANLDEIKNDIKWLKKNQFFFDGYKSKITVENSLNKNNNSGGWPYTAKKDRFLQCLSLIRYILHNPFDYSVFEGDIYESLVSKLSDSYTSKESRLIKKDCEKIVRPYFLKEKKTKYKNGYCIGNAVLTKSQLKDLWFYMEEASRKLGDSKAQSIYSDISKNLKWGGILSNELHPIRIFANHSIINQNYTNQYSLASVSKTNNKKNKIKLGINDLENAISKGQRIWIERLKSSAEYPSTKVDNFYPVWPIQIIFNNIAWYLAFEDIKGSSNNNGLIRVERLDRISLVKIDSTNIREHEKHKLSLKILNKLMYISGGIYFGENADLQKSLFLAESENDKKRLFTKVRFRTNHRIYKFMREGLQRYPLNQIKISLPLSGDNWKITNKKIFTLKPDSKNTHPFPIEILLPSWTVERDIDFQRWLFGFSDGIKIESPLNLKDRHIQFALGIRNLYI